MVDKAESDVATSIFELADLAELADYSLMEYLNSDPQGTQTGEDYQPRQVFSGHFVVVKPTPIADPQYVAHSELFFRELGFDNTLAQTEEFRQLFSGDTSQLPYPMRRHGWATGYALSIYGTEYTQQCPFKTGNGYGDGRAISVLEVLLNGQRWEMQLKGAGPTPYCRGADGRAVLRSSIREFLAQEHMHALGVPTSRSLSLFVSQSEQVYRPWYSEHATSMDPDTMVSDPVAISTRVAPSFLRVGQVELFGRRARDKAHPKALNELEMIVLHLIQREYEHEIDADLSTAEKVLALASCFRERLTTLICHWLRVGYCQGNFNSDNCACGGYTLDYGPFGFCERFEPFYQPWTGGGRHFSFLNQPAAAEANFEMFCKAVSPLLSSQPEALKQLNDIRAGFTSVMEEKMRNMWASKLGLAVYDAELVTQLLNLMIETSVDYNMFFRELSSIPNDLSALSVSFYQQPTDSLRMQWHQWLEDWRGKLKDEMDEQHLSIKMKQINPKYTWREWQIVPAYQQAKEGDYSLVRELQEILTHPFTEQSEDIAHRYYQLRPQAFFAAGGVSHYSCSS